MSATFRSYLPWAWASALCLRLCSHARREPSSACCISSGWARTGHRPTTTQSGPVPHFRPLAYLSIHILPQCPAPDRTRRCVVVGRSPQWWIRCSINTFGSERPFPLPRNLENRSVDTSCRERPLPLVTVSVTVYFDNHDNLYGYSQDPERLIEDRTQRQLRPLDDSSPEVNEVIEVTGNQHE